MEQEKRLDFLLDALFSELPGEKPEIPAGYGRKRALLRSLVNVRPPKPVSNEFIAMQDAFLKEEARQKGIVQLKDISHCRFDSRLALWQGDITRLEVDAIVNAANSQLLGCFVPGHGCIDNAIHTAAGVQLRQECYELMQGQRHAEQAGDAKITKAYNLPCKYVIHTVGPVVAGKLTQADCNLLAACYRSCLALASRSRLRSLAFCCISTGEFHFPNRQAAQIAVAAVKDFFAQCNTSLHTVAFNVFGDIDHQIYSELLCM